MPSIVPRLVGDPRFYRYVIVDRCRPSERFWTGQGWARQIHKARLYADIDDVNRTITRLHFDMLR